MRAALRRAPAAVALGLACWSGAAGAAGIPAEPDEPGKVHINAIKDPELWTYRAIVAGLDKFDEQHALAPAVPQLLFKVEERSKGGLAGEAVGARIAADEFSIPLALDGERRFVVPRSEAAYDARAELLLNRKKQDARVVPWVRTPGLPDDRRRLGDVRLDCKVMVAIAKEEIPFWAVGLINGFMLTTDWCSWFKGQTPKGGDRSWPNRADAALAGATLREGDRSLALKVSGKSFQVPVGDTSWGNDALIELEFAPASPEPAAPAENAPDDEQAP